MIRMIRMTNDSELVIQTSKNRKASLISESSKENQTDRQIVNPKRNKKPSLINETPNLESDSRLWIPRGRQNHFWYMKHKKMTDL